MAKHRHLPLSKETIAGAYEYLVTTPPFNEWNMPDASDISFRVMRRRDESACIYRWREGKQIKYQIGVSSGCVGHTMTLMVSVAHEMLHLHMDITGMSKSVAEHNAAFWQIADEICQIHGFDPQSF